MRDTTIYSFVECELDLGAWRLLRAGTPVALEPRAIELLALLVERAGEVVSKNEILDLVWKNAAVTENAMVRVIANLRSALGDDAREPRYIETVHTRGYRFVAQVTRRRVATTAAEMPVPAQRPFRAILVAAAVAGAVVLVASAVVVLGRLGPSAAPGPTPESIPSVAVLPFDPLGADDQRVFADGMTEAITTQLAKIGALKVITRRAVMHYRDRRPALPQIARELGVAHVVEGTAMQAGGRVRVTAHLVECASSRELWAESWEGDLVDVLELQASVARAIAREIRARVTPEEERLLASTRTVSPAAYSEYLYGLSLRDRVRGAKEPFLPLVRAMIERFGAAVALEPEWGEAHGQLAEAYRILGGTSDDHAERLRNLALARRSAERALEIDPTVVSAHTAMARVLFLAGDWDAAEREFRAAERLQPNSADWRFGVHLMYAGRFEEAYSRLLHAQERYPNTPWIFFDIGALRLCEGNLDAAQLQVSELRQRFHDEPLAALLEAKVLSARGRHAEAVELLERHREALLVNWATTFLQRLSYAAASAGQPEVARRAIRELEARGGRADFSTLLALGDMAELERRVEESRRERSYHLRQARCWPGYASLMRIPEVARALREAGPPPLR